MKNTAKLILISLLSVLVLLFAISCGGGECTDHDWQELEYREATCVENGAAIYECMICYETKREVINARGEHVPGNLVLETSSTCTTKGNAVYLCADCNTDFEVELALIEHVSVAYEEIAATCVADGRTGGSYCSACQAELTAPTVVTATGTHTPTDYETVDANCGEKGYTGGTYCSVCEAHLTDRAETEPTGEHTEEIIAAVAPTCTEVGYTEGVRCSVCETVLTAPKEVDRVAHAYSAEVTAPPAFEVEGVKTYTCSSCGDSYTESIPALTYSPDDIWDGTKADGYASGSGTAADPYVIETAEQFYYFYYQASSSNSFEGVYVKLAKDIILNDISTYDSWSRVAPANTRLQPICQIGFKGHFDGCGYAIRGWYSSGNYAGGLFDKIAGGSVKNLRMTEAYINNTASSATVGGIVTQVVPHDDTVVISGCEFSGIIKNKKSIGGIIGWASLGSYGHTSVTTRRDTYGNLTVSDCKAYGNFSNSATSYDKDVYIGGIFGQVKYTYTTLSVTNCTNYATINSRGNAGGISGNFTNTDGYSYRLYVTLTNLRNEGNVTGLGNVAGISPTASIISDYKDENYNTLYISDCSNIGEITSNGNSQSSSMTAGLFGRVSASGSSYYYTKTSYLINCYNTGKVTQNGNGYSIAGLVGSISLQSLTSYIKNCFNSGDVIAPASSNVGGLFGYVGTNNYHRADVDSCYNSGNVTGKEYVGGIAGYDGGARYTNVYNTGDITGVGVLSSDGETYENGRYVGGIMGTLDSRATLSNAYNVGSVSGSGNYVGSIVGSKNTNSGDIANAYYLEGCSLDGKGVTHGIYGNEYYAENLNSAATIAPDKASISSTYKNFDFSKVWNAPTGEEGSYPTLKNVVTIPEELPEETPAE